MDGKWSSRKLVVDYFPLWREGCTCFVIVNIQVVRDWRNEVNWLSQLPVADWPSQLQSAQFPNSVQFSFSPSDSQSAGSTGSPEESEWAGRVFGRAPDIVQLSGCGDYP